MKKFIFLLTSILLSTGIYAQFEIRPFIGANFSDLRTSPDGASTEAKLGGQIGANFLIGNKLHLMPGINYFARNTDYFTPDTDPNFMQITNGVMIPILLGFRFLDMDNDPFFNIRAFAGPSLMFLTKTELSNGVANETINWKESQWGAQVGVGIDVSIFFIDLGYEWGLSKTGDTQGFPGWNEIKTNTFFANIGARLKFAR